MKIISWNVNGIRAISKKGFAEWAQNSDADLICLQETKAHKEQLTDTILSIGDYQSHFSSAERKGYSGTAIYTRKKPNEIRHGFGIDRFDSEGRTVIAVYDNFILLNVYFPNGGASEERLAYKMDFYDAFLEHVKELEKEQPNILFCGDVNTAHKAIDLSRPKANEKTSGFLPEERAWIDQVLEAGYSDTFRMFHEEGECYSWWDYKTRARSRNVGWRIDYFFASQGIQPAINDASILSEVMGSDHCPVQIIVDEASL